MRTGLLAVGAAMVIVGAGVAIAVTMPFTSPGTSRTVQTWDSQVRAGTSKTYDVPASPSNSAAMQFDWNSTNATMVVWYVAGPCPTTPGWCLEGAIKSWTAGNTSGNWSGFGPAASGYCLFIHDSGSAPINFTGEFVESVPTPGHHLPMIPFAIVLSGGSILMGIGGLSIYLGLFLPSGTYGPRGPHSTEDTEAASEPPDGEPPASPE
ncbi:MAG: hypothetical protein WAK40_04910 [Thermoplasmata archaeon]